MGTPTIQQQKQRWPSKKGRADLKTQLGLNKFKTHSSMKNGNVKDDVMTSTD